MDFIETQNYGRKPIATYWGPTPIPMPGRIVKLDECRCPDCQEAWSAWERRYPRGATAPPESIDEMPVRWVLGLVADKNVARILRHVPPEQFTCV